MSKIKTKQKLQSQADRLDPTALCKKIIDELQLKNINGYRFFKKALGKRPKTVQGAHWNLIGHPVNKFPDDWDGELNHHEYFECFHYKSTLPKYISSIKNVGINDPVTELMRVKKEWSTLLSLLHSKSVFLKDKYEKLDEDVGYCPKTMVNYLKHKAMEPDPNFTSTYNWYYTGHGNLHIVTFNYQDYLLHSELSTLYLTEFVKDELKISSNSVCTFECGEDNNIFETLKENNFVILRCRHRIFILKIHEVDNTFTIEKIKNVYSEVPYTAVNFDKFHKNILYISKLDNNLVIINMDRMTAKNVELSKPPSLVDNWNTVMYSDRNYYCHVTQQSVEIYDKRTSSNAGRWAALTKNLDYNCNKISVAQKFDDCLYLGTTHHLLSLDIRYCKTFKPSILQRWTHNMKSPPTYIYKSIFEVSKDLICMASQWCEDVRLFVSETNDMLRGQTVSAATLPYGTPSILNTLNEAKWNLLCQDLYNPIDDRLSTCITGVNFFEDGEKYVILTQNSLGDISRHILYPEHLEMFMHDDSVEGLHEWGKGYREEPKQYEVTDVRNMFDKLMDLRDVSEDLSFLETETGKDVKFSSQEVVDTFTSDVVESALLDAWNIEDTDLVIQ